MNKVYTKEKGKIKCAICKKTWKTCNCWKEAGFKREGNYITIIYYKKENKT